MPGLGSHGEARRDRGGGKKSNFPCRDLAVERQREAKRVRQKE
jgi:hypothetical protein